MSEPAGRMPKSRWLGVPLILVLGAAHAQPPSEAHAPAKYHPGHYMTPYTRDRMWLQRAKEVCREQVLQGLELRVVWADLERGPGEYTFDDLDDLYTTLAACRKSLFLEIWAVNFQGSSQGIVPRDLEGELARTRAGYMAKLWHPEVMDRFIALHRALAERFDRQPYFEGVILTETATGGADGDYSPGAYIEQLTRAMRAIRSAWSNSQVIIFANFIPGSSTDEFRDLLETAASLGVGVGGPDVLPAPHHGSIGERIYRGELGGRDLRSRMFSAFSVQTPELGGALGNFTPEQLFDHCVRMNRCKYMFWARNTATGGPGQRWSTGILPFIREHPSF